jgi:hypothetical protein
MNAPKTDVPQDRYPGLRSFNSNEQSLFFGRKKEIDDLVDLVRAEQITVLFAKSGLGKSSLLNAGLCPKLETLNYQIIPIRFQKQITKADTNDPDDPSALSGNTLLTIVQTQLQGEFDLAWHKTKAPKITRKFYTDEQPRRLWEEVKVHPFPNGAIPIFVFDQFEEFFIYDETQRNIFMSQLAELMNDQAPARIIKWLLETKVYRRTQAMMEWSKQPLVKCIFSIRADRLFEMHKLREMIPMILRNRYELLALEDDRARDAIDRPAQADGLFTTPKFTIVDTTRELIIRVLSGRNSGHASMDRNDDNDCEIESSQLQIVCNFIENKLKEKVARGGEPVVGPDIIQNEESIDSILEMFYRTQLDSVCGPEELDKVQNVLENDLIVEGHRVGLAAAKMRQSFGDSETADRLIEKLIEARLIRADDSHLGRTYELSHDTLIEPVEKVKLLRLAQQKELAQKADAIKQLQIQREQDQKLAHERTQRRRFEGLTIRLRILGLIVIAAAIFIFTLLRNGRITLTVANSDWAEDAYDAGNQRLAYRLWESNDSLLHWIPFTKAELAAKTDTFMMAPFAGANTQFTLRDTSIAYVASLFQDNSFEVWKAGKNGSNYEKIDWLYDSLSVKSATELHLRNNFLVVFKHDSLLQVVDLTKREIVFPDGKTYYNLLTNHAILSQHKTRTNTNSSGFTTQTVLLPAKGHYLAAIDCQKKAHLYNLDQSFRPNTEFESRVNTQPGFRLDNLTFSASEKFLLIHHPTENRYDLLNLQTEQWASPYTNTADANFSPSGNRLIRLTNTRQLIVQNLSTQATIASVSMPDQTAEIADMVFTQDESILLLATTPGGERSEQDRYTLFRIDLKRPTPSLQRVGQNVRAYQSFRQAGHVLFADGPLSYDYDLAANSTRPFPAAITSIEQMGVTHLLYNNAPVPGPKTVYLYDVLNGQSANVTRFLSGNGERFAFYAPPGKADEKLIGVDSTKLTFFNLNRLTISEPDTLVAHGKTKFVPSSLALSGPLIKVKNQDDVVLCFFVDNRKNTLNYIVEHIYPLLSPYDRSTAGLPD